MGSQVGNLMLLVRRSNCLSYDFLGSDLSFSLQGVMQGSCEPEQFLFSFLFILLLDIYQYYFMTNSHPISRLDQLLSKNQTIYNNLKNRLIDISQSNQKISVNINNIKPYYENQSAKHQSSAKKPSFDDSSRIQSEYRMAEDERNQQKAEPVEPKSPRFRTVHEEEKKYSTFEQHQAQIEEDASIKEQFVPQKQFMQVQQKQQQKIQQRIQPQQYSCLYVPFNKLYRSPIVQYKDHHTLIFSRRSKTGIINKSASSERIIDGIKYKIKSLFTDEQELLKSIYQSEANNEILIVGGENCLKKKLHATLLTFVYHDLQSIIKKKTLGIDLMVKVDHQQIYSLQGEPTIKSTAFQFKDSDTENQITFLSMESFLKEIYYLMQKNTNEKHNKNQQKLRLTKVIVTALNQDPLKLTIISTNKYDAEFIQSLRIEKVVWCLNPLIKYYDEAKKTLEAMKVYSDRPEEKRIF